MAAQVLSYQYDSLPGLSLDAPLADVPLLAAEPAPPSLLTAAEAGEVQAPPGAPEQPSAPVVREEDFLGFEEAAPAPEAAQEAPADGQPQGGGAAPAKARQYGATPWTRPSHRNSSSLLRLHNEMAEFSHYLAPSSTERRERTDAIQRITDAVTSVWPGSRVELFGSFATGLFLPNSDIDLVIMDTGCGQALTGLKALAKLFGRKQLANNITIISKAKVPIIKFEESTSGYAFDISLDVANGPPAARCVVELVQQLPPMRPLVLVLKIFLQQRGFNEVFTGGIGSYALLVMVAAFLLLHPSRAAPGGLEGCLGALLLDFFLFYGEWLDTCAYAVSCRGGGSFVDKRAAGFLQYQGREDYLAVQDPTDAANDLSKGTFNFASIRAAFLSAYGLLSTPLDPAESQLQRIIRMDPVYWDRPKPAPLPPTFTAPSAQSPAGGKASGEDAQPRSGRKGKKRARAEAKRQPSPRGKRARSAGAAGSEGSPGAQQGQAAKRGREGRERRASPGEEPKGKKGKARGRRSLDAGREEREARWALALSSVPHAACPP